MNGHIKHGYLADVYQPWVSYEGSEWGEQMEALHSAYSMGEDYAGFSFEQLDQIEAILREHLYEAKYFLITDEIDPHYVVESDRAIEGFPHTRDYWKTRALEFGAEDAFNEADALIPDWMKP